MQVDSFALCRSFLTSALVIQSEEITWKRQWQWWNGRLERKFNANGPLNDVHLEA